MVPQVPGWPGPGVDDGPVPSQRRLRQGNRRAPQVVVRKGDMQVADRLTGPLSAHSKIAPSRDGSGAVVDKVCNSPRPRKAAPKPSFTRLDRVEMVPTTAPSR